MTTPGQTRARAEKIATRLCWAPIITKVLSLQGTCGRKACSVPARPLTLTKKHDTLHAELATVWGMALGVFTDPALHSVLPVSPDVEGQSEQRSVHVTTLGHRAEEMYRIWGMAR